MSTSTAWDGNLGPLTTLAILPTSCTTAFDAAETVALQGQTCTSDAAIESRFEDDKGCWPELSDVALQKSLEPPLGGFGYYSPGLICPSGYTTACYQTAGAGGDQRDYVFQFQPTSSETAYGCCPTGYTCAAYSGVQQCATQVVSSVIVVETCSYGTPAGTSLMTPQGSVLASEATGSLAATAITMFGPLIQIVRRRGDETLLLNSTKSTRLSNGAVAGISVAVTVLVLSLVGGAIYCFVKAKRRRSQAVRDEAAVVSHPPGSYESAPQVAEMQGHSVDAVEMPASTPTPYHGSPEKWSPAPNDPPQEMAHEGHNYVQRTPGHQAVELQ